MLTVLITLPVLAVTLLLLALAETALAGWSVVMAQVILIITLVESIRFDEELEHLNRISKIRNSFR